jgi:hypothetical protein
MVETTGTDHPSLETGHRAAFARRRAIMAGVVILTAALTGACAAHREPLTNPCPTLVGRGAVALAKLGLSSKELKLQEKC